MNIIYPFCESVESDRHWLKHPVQIGERIVASEGHILVAIPGTGGNVAVAANPLESMTKIVDACIARASDDTIERTLVKSHVVNLPPCNECSGDGISHVKECAKCEGYGNYADDAECSECSGLGVVERSKDDPTVPCGACYGAGVGLRFRHPSSFAANDGYGPSECYMALLARHFPDAQIELAPVNQSFYVRDISRGMVGCIAAMYVSQEMRGAGNV